MLTGKGDDPRGKGSVERGVCGVVWVPVKLLSVSIQHREFRGDLPSGLTAKFPNWNPKLHEKKDRKYIGTKKRSNNSNKNYNYKMSKKDCARRDLHPSLSRSVSVSQTKSHTWVFRTGGAGCGGKTYLLLGREAS